MEMLLCRTNMDGVLVETVPRRGSYDIAATKVVQDSDLQTPTVFACELRIPEAQYSVSKRLVYYPGKGHRIVLQYGDMCFRFLGYNYTTQVTKPVVLIIYLRSSAYCLMGSRPNVATASRPTFSSTHCHRATWFRGNISALYSTAFDR
jgi:hypothetical protein